MWNCRKTSLNIHKSIPVAAVMAAIPIRINAATNSWQLFLKIWENICRNYSWPSWITPFIIRNWYSKIISKASEQCKWAHSSDISRELRGHYWLCNFIILHSCSGLSPYIFKISMLRMIGHYKFAFVNMEILKMTKHPEDSTIKIRWRISGITGFSLFRQMWKFKVWKPTEMLDRKKV